MLELPPVEALHMYRALRYERHGRRVSHGRDDRDGRDAPDDRHRRPRRDDRGVIALEFVLALPFLLMLLIGVVVLGNALSVKTQTTGLARDGARAAALRKPLPPDTVIVGSGCPDPTDTSAFVTVQATKPITLRSVPFLPTLLPADITETVTMRCGG